MPSVTNTFSANSKIQSAQVNQNFTDLVNAIRTTFVFPVTGTLATGTSLTATLVVPATLTIVKAYVVVKTAPTGAAIIVDINKNGTSLWSVTPGNRVQIADGATTGYQTIFDTTALAEGDLLTIDLDQVGSTTSGVDLTIELKCS